MRKDVVAMIAHQQRYAYLPARVNTLVEMLSTQGWPKDTDWASTFSELTGESILLGSRSQKTGAVFEVYFP